MKHPETGEVLSSTVNRNEDVINRVLAGIEEIQFVQRSHVIQNMVYVNTVTDVT